MPVIPPKGKVVDFDIVSESWQTFVIKDKMPVILRARVLLTKVIHAEQVNQDGQRPYAVGTSAPIFVTIVPSELQGPPTIPMPSSEQLSESVIDDLKFESKNDPWNEYRLKDGTTVLVKLNVSGVLKTPYFGNDGDPLYVVNQNISARVVPTELRNKAQGTSSSNSTVIM